MEKIISIPSKISSILENGMILDYPRKIGSRMTKIFQNIGLLGIR
jgi:hypothetical protein